MEKGRNVLVEKIVGRYSEKGRNSVLGIQFTVDQVRKELNSLIRSKSHISILLSKPGNIVHQHYDGKESYCNQGYLSVGGDRV